MPVMFLLFILFPTLELVLLIKLGSVIGVSNTIGIVLVTAFIGASLLRRQSLNTLINARQRMDQGQAPALELVEGAILVFAGALLLTPGFMTDLFGLVCLLPGARRVMARRLMQSAFMQVGEVQFGAANVRRGAAPDSFHQAGDGETIEGEFRRKD